MPITLTIPENILDPQAQGRVFAELTDALLKIEHLTTNAFMGANVVGSLQVLPRHHVFSGGKPSPAAFIELKLPEIALATPEAKRAFIEEATAIVERAAEGRLRRDHIWTNIVYAAEGSWGISGRAYASIDLVEAVRESA